VSKSKTPPKPEHITRNDLESRFAGLQNSLTGQLEDRKQSLVTIAGGVSVAVLILFFLLGRRSGKKKTTLVEIRRV
jgi:hypothetical protein